MTNPYVLAEACQNTFVIYDAINLHSIDPTLMKQIHSILLREKRDDCMILVDGRLKDDAFYVRMLVLGVDGEMGEFCGNGSRACAAYLFSRFPQYKNFFLVSNRGEHRLLKHENGLYSTYMPRVNFVINSKFVAKPELFVKTGPFQCTEIEGKHLFYADAIEPHLVVKESLTDEELESFGRVVNQKRDIFPLGINLNSVRVLSPDAIRVRTYERGVQRLTQSCGTGPCCSAAWFLNDREGKVKVTTEGGPLEISLLPNELEMKGPAIVIF